MAFDEVSLACRLSGLSLDELWLRYLAIGGERSRAELESRLDAARWPEPEDRYLAVVADEALLECGLPRFALPLSLAHPFSDVSGPGEGDEQGVPSAAAVVLEARALGARLTTLFEQCARVRANARGVRQHARSVRRAGPASGEPSRGC